MKSVLLTAAIAGIAIAGVILYLTSGSRPNGQVINVEDGFAIDA